MPTLVCSVCNNRFEEKLQPGKLGTYCPRCGSALDLRSFMILPQIRDALERDVLATFLGGKDPGPGEAQDLRNVVREAISDVFSNEDYREALFGYTNSEADQERIIRAVCQRVMRKLQP